MQGIGKVIAEYRKAKGLTQKELADLLYCQQQFISRLERDQYELPKDYQIKLSKILDFDFVSLYRNIENYKTFEHYLLANELIHAIEKKDNCKVKSILESNPSIHEFTYGKPLILRQYSFALVNFVFNKNYERALDTCLKIFNLDNISDIKNLELEVAQEYRYYSAVLVLSQSLKAKNEIYLALSVLESTTKFLEQTYFNILPVSSIDHFFKRFYIAVLNNYSETLLRLNEHGPALENCNKAIDFATENESLYPLDFLLELKIEILYRLEKLDEAKEIYDQLFSLCKLTKNMEFLEETDALIKEKYPLLLEV